MVAATRTAARSSEGPRTFTITELALEFVDPTFLALTDTPSSFTGAGSKLVKVNSGATALEFVAVPALPYLLAFDAPGVPTASMDTARI